MFALSANMLCCREICQTELLCAVWFSPVQCGSPAEHTEQICTVQCNRHRRM